MTTEAITAIEAKVEELSEQREELVSEIKAHLELSEEHIPDYGMDQLEALHEEIVAEYMSYQDQDGEFDGYQDVANEKTDFEYILYDLERFYNTL